MYGLFGCNCLWQHEMHVVAGAAALVGQVLTHYREGKDTRHKRDKVNWGDTNCAIHSAPQ